MTTCFIVLLLPLIDYKFSSGKLKPLFRIWDPLNLEEDHTISAYLIQAIGVFLECCYQMVTDTFIITFMIYAIGQLKILQFKIKRITQDLDDEDLDADDNRQKIYDRFVDCIQDHYFIMRFVEILNEIVSPIIFMYYFLCGFMLCAQGFQMSVEGIALNSDIQHLLAMLIQLFVFFWYGNEIVAETDCLLFATYECEWYNQDSHFKKCLINYRSGLIVPIQLTVGKFFLMSLPTFLNILKTAYSTYALLKTMQDKEI